MSMNYKLSAELYGNNLWMIDPLSFNSMWSILNDMRNGVKYEHEGEKLNNSTLYNVSNASLIQDVRHLDMVGQNEDLVHIINLNGVITKNGGPSTNGTKQIAQQIRKMDSDNRVKGHLIIAGSGGGAGNAIKVLTNAIKSAKKPVETFIEQGEMACSACYGIISATGHITAEDNDVIVGSLGTMISLSGRPKESKDSQGQLHVRFYATKSTQKNGYYEEAMEGNGKPMIEHVLDPANERFLNAIKENRPSVDESTQMDGSVFKAGDVVGTMIDKIGSFESAVNRILNPSNKDTNTNINTNNKKMTKQEIENSHPDVYNAIKQEGVLAERDRVGAFMAHVNTDTQAVAEGIESGEQLSNTQREKFFVKANSMKKMESMQENNAEDLLTPESATLEQLKQKEIEKEQNDAFDFKLN